MSETYKVGVKEGYFPDRIKMIKAYRSSFRVADETGEMVYAGIGLREAKDACDEMASGGLLEMTLNDDNIRQLQVNGFLVEGKDFVVKRVPKVTVYRQPDNKKIQAIKDFRGCTQWGLLESKIFVDELYGYNRPVVVDNLTNLMIRSLRDKGFTVHGAIDECFKGQEDLFEI